MQPEPSTPGAPVSNDPALAGIRTVVRTAFLQTVVLVAVACLAAKALDIFHWEWKPGAAFAQMSVSEVRKKLPGLVVIDVRAPERFAQAHVPGAIHFEETRPEECMAAVRAPWGPGKSLVVYGEGQGSDRAERVAHLLKKGFPAARVYLLEGGWAAWPQ